MAPGLYIHVPFCRTRCDFCAFYLRVYRASDTERYLQGLLREIELHAERGTLAGRRVSTVYFGGGTPTVLGAEGLTTILHHVRRRLGVEAGAEITVEAHPQDLNAEFARCLVAAGCTRLSLGAQSFDESELLSLGRPSLPQHVVTAVADARRAGTPSLNLDLMFGLPGQDESAWQQTLQAALALSPDHLSCYALTVEPHTKTALDIAQSRLAPPDAAHQHLMEEATTRRLARSGYERYEISNYARPGHRCRHNLLYWMGAEYLGLGPSAQSYVDGVRFGIRAHLDDYCRSLQGGVLPIEQMERLSPHQQSVEAVIFGLRRLEGVDTEMVAEAGLRHPEWLAALDRLIGGGLVEDTGSQVRLTERGRRFADTVAEALI